MSVNPAHTTWSKARTTRIKTLKNTLKRKIGQISLGRRMATLASTFDIAIPSRRDEKGGTYREGENSEVLGCKKEYKAAKRCKSYLNDRKASKMADSSGESTSYEEMETAHTKGICTITSNECKPTKLTSTYIYPSVSVHKKSQPDLGTKSWTLSVSDSALERQGHSPNWHLPATSQTARRPLTPSLSKFHVSYPFKTKIMEHSGAQIQAFKSNRIAEGKAIVPRPSSPYFHTLRPPIPKITSPPYPDDQNTENCGNYIFPALNRSSHSMPATSSLTTWAHTNTSLMPGTFPLPNLNDSETKLENLNQQWKETLCSSNIRNQGEITSYSVFSEGPDQNFSFRDAQKFSQITPANDQVGIVRRRMGVKNYFRNFKPKENCLQDPVSSPKTICSSHKVGKCNRRPCRLVPSIHGLT